MHRELLERCWIPEGLEELAVQFLTKVHIPFDAIREAQVNRVVLYLTCVRDSRYHFYYPSVTDRTMGSR